MDDHSQSRGTVLVAERTSEFADRSSVSPIHSARSARLAPFVRILAATDFSSASAKAVQVAARLAAQCGASLTLLHVVDVNPRAAASHVGDAAALMGELRRKGAAEMARLLKDLMEEELPADAIITEGLPWEEVQKYSDGFDLLVLGKAPARRRWSFFSSHITERTLRTVICPVVIV